MKKNTTILFIVLVFILPATAWALMNWYEKKVQALPVMGKTREHRVADFSLVNQDNEVVTMRGLNNKIVVADFFFSHCPTICPQMTKNLVLVQAAFAGDPEVQILSFSVDPERDSPGILKKFAERFGIDKSKWQLLTGDKREIYKLARNSFLIVATDGDGGPDDFIHSEKLVLVDQDKKIRGFYDGTSSTETKQLIADIKKLKK